MSTHLISFPENTVVDKQFLTKNLNSLKTISRRKSRNNEETAPKFIEGDNALRLLWQNYSKKVICKVLYQTWRDYRKTYEEELNFHKEIANLLTFSEFKNFINSHPKFTNAFITEFDDYSFIPKVIDDHPWFFGFPRNTIYPKGISRSSSNDSDENEISKFLKELLPFDGLEYNSFRAKLWNDDTYIPPCQYTRYQFLDYKNACIQITWFLPQTEVTVKFYQDSLEICNETQSIGYSYNDLIKLRDYVKYIIAVQCTQLLLGQEITKIKLTPETEGVFKKFKEEHFRGNYVHLTCYHRKLTNHIVLEPSDLYYYLEREGYDLTKIR